jgi:hypothetical protein
MVRFVLLLFVFRFNSPTEPLGTLDDLLGEDVDWNDPTSSDDGSLPNLAGLSISNHRYGFAGQLTDSLDGLQVDQYGSISDQLIGRKFCFYLKNDRSSKLFLVRK